VRNLDNTSLQAGARYEFSEALSIFGSYSESFQPVTGLDIFNDPLPPTTGEGYEVGVKGQLFSGRLAYTVSYFDITNENIARAPLVIPPDAPNPLGSVPAGEENAEGVDVDISGAITENWSVIFSFGYLDSEADDGFALPNIADFNSALFTRYDVTVNWCVSIAYEFVGERLGVSDIDGDPATFDPLRVDPHFIGNAAVYYQRGRFNAQLNVSNIFDEEYVDSVGGLARQNYAGAPTEALLTLGVEF
ncbi:MAG: TonB-dependent receptor, partial [Pseudomonadota bacterium]